MTHPIGFGCLCSGEVAVEDFSAEEEPVEL